MTWLGDKVNSLDNPAAPTTPSRAIGTAFQPSTTKYVLGQYTIEMDSDAGESVLVELLSDAANPPTTARASAKNALTGGTKLVARQQLTYLVPPGHYVKLVVTQTGTSSIANQVETEVS